MLCVCWLMADYVCSGQNNPGRVANRVEQTHRFQETLERRCNSVACHGYAWSLRFRRSWKLRTMRLWRKVGSSDLAVLCKIVSMPTTSVEGFIRGFKKVRRKPPKNRGYSMHSRSGKSELQSAGREVLGRVSRASSYYPTFCNLCTDTMNKRKVSRTDIHPGFNFSRPCKSALTPIYRLKTDNSDSMLSVISKRKLSLVYDIASASHERGSCESRDQSLNRK